MNIIPELESQVNIKAEKIQLLFNGKETVFLNYIIDWDVEYDKTGTSAVTAIFVGANRKLLDMQRYKARLNFIKIIGSGLNFESGESNNIVLNIPCDMCIDSLSLNNNEATNTEVTFTGDMW